MFNILIIYQLETYFEVKNVEGALQPPPQMANQLSHNIPDSFLNIFITH